MIGRLAQEVSRLTALQRYLRLAPFDGSTAEGRANERYRRAAWSFVTNLASQTLGVLVVVLSVGLTVDYLGKERFGLWMTIASFTAVLNFLDFGYGNALINRIALAAAGENPADLRRVVSGGLGLLAALAVAWGAVLSIVAHYRLVWPALFGVTDPALLAEARQTFVLFAALFAANLFSGGIIKVLGGVQRAYYANCAASAGHIASLVLLVALSRSQVGIPILLLSTLGVQAVAPLFLLPVVWHLVAPGPIRLAAAMRDALSTMSRQAGAFALLQFGAVFASRADSVILASVAGAAAVATLAVVQKLFQLVSIPLNLANAPLWAAYADAYARGERGFVRRTLRRSMLTSLGMGTVGGSMVALASPWLIARWTSGTIVVDPSVVYLYAAWMVIEVAGNAFAMFMNAAGVLRPQVAAVVATTPLTIAVKILAAHWFGIAGMLAATITVYLATMAVICLYAYRAELEHALHV